MHFQLVRVESTKNPLAPPSSLNTQAPAGRAIPLRRYHLNRLRSTNLLFEDLDYFLFLFDRQK